MKMQADEQTLRKYLVDTRRMPLTDVWAQLMLADKFLGFEETAKAGLSRVAELPLLETVRQEIASGRNINQVMERFDEILEFDGTGIQPPAYVVDFINSQPHFFRYTEKPNCLGRAVIIGSVMDRKGLKVAEVLRTNKLNEGFFYLNRNVRELEDDGVYQSVDGQGNKVQITGRQAKESVLEGILYDEGSHPMVLSSKGEILDDLESRFGMPPCVEHDYVKGIAALTANNLIGIIGLYGHSIEPGFRNEEARELLKQVLRLAPDSVVIRRNEMLFSYDPEQVYEKLGEIERIYSSKKVTLPHDLAIVKAHYQALLGKTQDARQTLSELKERYLLPDALELIAQRVPLLNETRMLVGE
jgi:hypothetical protein